jgi:hypothetical protein
MAQLLVMCAGSALAAAGVSVAATLAGAVLIGLVLAPLATHYSLVLDTLAPPHRRAEVFALMRTANACGVILASALLTARRCPTALLAIAGVMAAATISVGRGGNEGAAGDPSLIAPHWVARVRSTSRAWPARPSSRRFPIPGQAAAIAIVLMYLSR